jgi:uncharacterized protein (DUF2461 family)
MLARPASWTRHRRAIRILAVNFGGFGTGAFAYFERVEAQPSWAAVQLLREDWDQHVHAPMEALLDQLGAEFGRDGYAYHLHRDPYLWSHQVGIISLADTIGYRLVLSLQGLVAAGGWMRSSPDQVQRYRQSVASDLTGREAQSLVAQAQARGFAIEGQQLARAPRGWPADHPRIELLRHRTLFASRQVPARHLATGPRCAEAVAGALRQLHPLTAWLAEHVGPRQPR